MTTNETGPTIRTSAAADAQAITSIYNHAVASSTATFDVREKTTDERLRWLSQHSDDYPVVVAEVDGVVVGWGSLTSYGDRAGWRYTVENAVYIHPNYCGRGIGRAVMEELIARAAALGYHVIIAQVVAGNDASVALHEKLGFEEVGRLREAGRKFGHWLDVILMEKLLPAKE